MPDKLWEKNGLTGTLRKGDLSVAVEFDVACDAHGALEFKFAEIPMNADTRWLREAWDAPGRYAQTFQLSGRHEDGTTVSTDHFYFDGMGGRHAGDEGSTRTMKGSTSWLETVQPVELAADAPVAVYRIVGIEGFGVLRTEVPEGRLEIGAETRPADYGRVTGWIRITGTPASDDDLAAWVERCDERMMLVLDVFSLMLDCRLWWSVREVRDQASLSLLFRGPTPEASRPQHPILSKLHLQPAVDLIPNYTSAQREELGIGTALALFLLRPAYVEASFIAAMTGLDHVLHKHDERHPSVTLVSKTVFRARILPHVEQALNESINGLGDEVTEDAASALRAKLKVINQTTMRNKLLEFLAHHNVPLAGITHEQLTDLIRVRNDLFHGRDFEAQDDEQLHDHLALLQELMRRVFLTLLGFRGHRSTYLNGQEWVEFPPTE